jgi:CheY-like chemotaxis protein
VLSHELRTPLTPVLLAVMTLLQDESTKSKHSATLEMIQRNIEIEARLVDDLLDVAKIERGNLRLELGPVDIHAALREAGEICQPEILRSGIHVEWDLAASQSYAMADSGRIRQVFWNLIRNATKYTPAEGRLRIRSSNSSRFVAGRSQEHVIVEFADTGVGIEPELLARIFEPFEQGELTGRSRDGGLGLGLAISRSIVHEHGGRLVADSPGRGAGATFSVELSSIPKPAPIASHPSAQLPLDGASILIVEDNEDTRRFLELVLRTHGLDVTVAKDLSSARTAIAEREHDLLLSDIELPDGTGLELMHDLSAAGRIRGVAMSGFGSADDVAASLRAGFAEHLTKPIRVDNLVSAISRALARPRVMEPAGRQ